jgi:Flp pilus assembly pilin Flp
MKRGLGAATARLIENERGATMVEYALMLTLIAAVGFVTLTLMGVSVSHIFSRSAGGL